MEDLKAKVIQASSQLYQDKANFFSFSGCPATQLNFG